MRPDHRAVVAVVALLAIRNVAGEAWWPSTLYVPVNLGMVVLLTLIARRRRLSADELGLARAAGLVGLRVGAMIAVVAVVVIGVGAVVPWTRSLFEDERVADVDGVGELAYQALVRIPLGTALFEEFAFRGVLLALVARSRSTRAAVVVSSVLFGLWHIRPTLGALETNDLASDGLSAVAAVAGAVAVTTVAGVVFCRLRLVTGSLLAPVVLHATINSVAMLAAYLVLAST